MKPALPFIATSTMHADRALLLKGKGGVYSGIWISGTSYSEGEEFSYWVDPDDLWDYRTISEEEVVQILLSIPCIRS